MLQSICLFLFFLVLNLTALSSMAAPLRSTDLQHEIDSSEIAFFIDRSARLGIDDVSRIGFADKFQTTDRRLSLGYSKDVIWLKITLQRDTLAPQDWLLELSNTFINDLRLYSPGAVGFSVSQAGDRFPFADRDVPYHHPVFKVKLTDANAQTFYLRLESDSSLSMQLLLWQPAALRDAGQAEIILLGGALGMSLMSVLVAMVHWLNSREPSILHFVGLSIVILIFIPAQLGLLSQFVFPHAPLIADLLVPWTLGITCASVALVFLRPLEAAKDYPQLVRILRLMAALGLLAPLTRELDLYWMLGGPALQVLLISSLLMSGWISLQRWRKKLVGAGFFLAAHIVLIAALLSSRIMLLGLLPFNALVYSSWVLALLAFLLLTHAGILVDARVALSERVAAREAAEIAHGIAQQEAKLRQEQTIFFSFVAHELRTPLGIIVAGLKNLGRDLADADEKTHSRIQRLTRAVQRMGALVEQHLNLQRLSRADFLPRFDNVPPTGPAQVALLNAREAWPRRLFELTCAPCLPQAVRVDAELVILAIANLLGNAAKYSPADRPVQLVVFFDTLLRYQVVDLGLGISPQEQERLFRVIERSHSVDGKAGFGIGLAIAHRVAAIHQGSLTYGDGIGGGAIFTLSLPAGPISME